MSHQAVGNGKTSFTYAELEKIMEPIAVFYITYIKPKINSVAVCFM